MKYFNTFFLGAFFILFCLDVIDCTSGATPSWIAVFCPLLILIFEYAEKVWEDWHESL